MSDEVREAAQRVLQWMGETPPEEPYDMPIDAETIAQAYLALIPADDSLPLDEAWLRSVDWYEHYASMCYQKVFTPNREEVRISPTRCRVWVDACPCEGPKCWTWRLFVREELVKEDPARQDIRDACRLFGIHLTEPSQ